jgi:hypothetical protein
MHRVPLIMLVLFVLCLGGLVAGSALTQAADRGDRSDRGGPPAVSPTGVPPGPPMKGSPDEGRGRDIFRTAPIWNDITDEDVTKIMAFVGENMPWMKADLEKLKESDQARFRMVCRHMRFDIEQLKALQKADPKAFKDALEERKLRAEVADLAAKARATTDPKELEALKEQLRPVLGQLFDKELAVRTAQIAEIEKRLDSLRKDLKDRTAGRKDIVETRMDAMLKGVPEGAGDRPAPPPGKGPSGKGTPPSGKTPPPPDPK